VVKLILKSDKLIGDNPKKLRESIHDPKGLEQKRCPDEESYAELLRVPG
jgi:hypothetical protein